MGEVGKEILKSYADILKITVDDASKIVEINKTAKAFLEEELALSVTWKNKNIGILLSLTLLRSFCDFSPIRESEKKTLERYYGIKIGDD